MALARWQQPLYHWKLDNNALDSAGDKDGTETNMAYSNAIKVTGNYSGDFDGTAYIEIPFVNLQSYTNYSISVWVKTDYSGGTYFSESDTGSTFGYIWFHQYDLDGQIEYYVRQADDTILYRYQSGIDYEIGKWHHFVATDANGTVKCYGDGKLITAMSQSYTRASVSADVTHIGVLERSSGLISYCGGNIDDVRIYDVALTEAEARALYNSYFTEKALSFMGTMG